MSVQDALHIERKRFLDIWAVAERVGPYDEMPLLPPDIDPQLCLSRNTKRQPFYLICEKDTMLTAMSGDAWIEFRETSVIRHRFLAGDFCYVPAGTPHRIAPLTTSLHLRYKAREAGLEGVAWYCETCGEQIHRIEWDTAQTSPQAGYFRSCRYYADALAGTPCRRCGTAAPELDLEGVRWEALAAEGAPAD